MKLNLRGHFILILATFLVSLASLSQTNLEVENAESGLVEIEQQDIGTSEVYFEKVIKFNAPYKQRRGKHGAIFSIGTEKFYPKEMLSLLDDANIDSILNRKPVDMFTVELGYKYNFFLGALALTAGYAAGSAKGILGGASRIIDFKRQSILAAYYLDNIFREPWIVPYGAAGITQFVLDEEKIVGTAIAAGDSITADPSLSYKFGMLFQLNWIESGIDTTTHSDGLRSSGLENTYLDINVSWHDPTSDLYDPKRPVATKDSDPNLDAEAQVGMGLKLEF